MSETDSIDIIRKKQIQASAKKLFLTYGYAQTNVEAIARDAGISKGLIYHYFTNKEALFFSFYDEMEAYLKDLRNLSDPQQALIRFGTDFLVTDPDKYAHTVPLQMLLITFAQQDIDISWYAERNPVLMDFGRGYLSFFFQKAIGQGIYRKGDPQVYGDIYWSFLLGKLLQLKKGRETADPEVYVKEVLASFKEE